MKNAAINKAKFDNTGKQLEGDVRITQAKGWRSLRTGTTGRCLGTPFCNFDKFEQFSTFFVRISWLISWDQLTKLEKVGPCDKADLKS